MKLLPHTRRRGTLWRTFGALRRLISTAVLASAWILFIAIAVCTAAVLIRIITFAVRLMQTAL